MELILNPGLNVLFSYPFCGTTKMTKILIGETAKKVGYENSVVANCSSNLMDGGNILKNIKCYSMEERKKTESISDFEKFIDYLSHEYPDKYIFVVMRISTLTFMESLKQINDIMEMFTTHEKSHIYILIQIQISDTYITTKFDMGELEDYGNRHSLITTMKSAISKMDNMFNISIQYYLYIDNRHYYMLKLDKENQESSVLAVDHIVLIE